jgi:TPR repeat protein
MYGQGEGVTKDVKKFREWMAKAAAQGDEQAIAVLRQIEEIGRTTTSSESTFSKKDVIVCCSTCQTPQTESFVLKKCSCHAAQYCNKTCQKKHRKEHKKECRQLTAARKLKKKNKTKKKDKTMSQEEEEGERKEDVTTKPKKKKEEEEKGDECCICLEELPKDDTKFTRMLCCGNGMHDHCTTDLKSMKMAGTCPLCRTKQPTSHEEAIKYLRPWVKKKKAWAQSMMGQRYERSMGVKQSYEMARMLYEQAAQQGDANAMCDLGVMYHHGEGVEQSYERAVEYYEQAAQLGFDQAQYNLGCCYANGEGVEQNMATAKKWAEKSAAQGDEDAIAILKSLKNFK